LQTLFQYFVWSGIAGNPPTICAAIGAMLADVTAG
jgi:hypothetical protein